MGKADYALMAEYHRGYEDGRAARAADEWALHQKRVQAMNRVDEYITNGCQFDDSPFWAPTLPGVILALLDTDMYCLDDLVAGLKELLGADEDVRKPFTEYDVLGNERHKAICRLEESKPLLGMTKTEILGDLGKAITNAPNFDPTDIDHLNIMWSDLIYLLGGDNEIRPNANGTCPNDDPIYADDFAMRPLPTPNRDFAKVTEQSITITSELRDAIKGCSANDCIIIEVSRLNAIADRIDDDVKHVTIDTRQSSYDFMCLEIDRLNTSMKEERQMYLDLLRDAAMDYRSLQQADELRMRVLDAAIEENKSLRKKLMEHDTAEHIVRDLTLGKITESDAIKRIEKLGESE